MLEDRYYMRHSRFGRYRSMTVMLVIVNVAAFILQLILNNIAELRVFHYLALSLDGLREGYLWQLITFQFLHGNFLHLLFNCLTIFIFGRDVEEELGRKRFLALYFSSGVIGGLVQILAGLFFDAGGSSGVVGASAGGFGLVAALAMLYPDRPLMLFPIPVGIRAKYLLLFFAGSALVLMIFPSRNSSGVGVAHAAHLGGILTGVIFIRYAVHWELPRFVKTRRHPLRRLVKVPSEKGSSWGQTRAETDDLPAEEFLSKAVDPILDKISAQGIQSLTDRERRILQAAREKMAKR